MLALQILILVGSAGMVVSVLRKIPVLLKLPARPQEVLPAQSFFLRLRTRIKDLKYSEYRVKVLSWFEKALRKARLLFLKIDNFFLSGIKKAREGSQTWKIRSRAWVEHKREKKIKKLEALQGIEKEKFIDKIKETKSGDGGKDNAAKKEKELIKAISRNPKNPQLYKDLGFLYLDLENYKDAQQAFEQTLKLAPFDKEVKEKLDKINILRGEG